MGKKIVIGFASAILGLVFVILLLLIVFTFYIRNTPYSKYENIDMANETSFLDKFVLNETNDCDEIALNDTYSYKINNFGSNSKINIYENNQKFKEIELDGNVIVFENGYNQVSLKDGLFYIVSKNEVGYRLCIISNEIIYNNLELNNEYSKVFLYQSDDIYLVCTNLNYAKIYELKDDYSLGKEYDIQLDLNGGISQFLIKEDYFIVNNMNGDYYSSNNLMFNCDKASALYEDEKGIYTINVLPFDEDWHNHCRVIFKKYYLGSTIEHDNILFDKETILYYDSPLKCDYYIAIIKDTVFFIFYNYNLKDNKKCGYYAIKYNKDKAYVSNINYDSEVIDCFQYANTLKIVFKSGEHKNFLLK